MQEKASCNGSCTNKDAEEGRWWGSLHIGRMLDLLRLRCPEAREEVDMASRSVCTSPSGTQERHAVISLLRGAEPLPSHPEPHPWEGAQPAVQGPCHKQVHGFYFFDGVQLMPISSMDPSIAMGFYCQRAGEGCGRWQPGCPA